MFSIKNARLLETGKQKDEVYSNEDIDSMVENFNAYSKRLGAGAPLFEVPIVLGHDKVQILLKITGLPSAGWISNTQARWDVVDLPKVDDEGQPIFKSDGIPEIEPHEGYFLFGDISGIPEIAAQWILDGQYRYVSVELNKRDKAPPGLQVSPFKGFMLQRVAILGGSNPYVKTLGELPNPELESSQELSSVFSEFDPTQSNLVYFCLPPLGGRGSLSCFSEDVPMNDQLFQSLLKQNVPQEVAQQMAGMDPATYAGIAKCYADATVQGGFDRAAAIEKLGGLPNADRDSLSKMTDDELQALMQKNGFASDPKPAPDAHDNTPKDPPFGGTNTHTAPRKFADDPKPEDKKEDSQKMSAVLQAQRSLELKMRQFEAWQKDQDRKQTVAAKAQRDRDLAEKHKEIDVFCADIVTQRRCTPGEAKAYAATMKRMVSITDADVVTFSVDGEEKIGSPLEALMAEIKARPQLPSRFFSGDGMPAGGSTLTNGQKANPARVKRMLGAFTEGQETLAKKEKAAASAA